MTRSERMGRSLALAMVLAGPGGSAWAQDATSDDVLDLTMPDMDAPTEYRTCPDREARPEWLENVEVENAYKGLLLMAIYEARTYEAIVATGDCSCEVKAPSWDAASAEYQEVYAALDYEGHAESQREFRTLKGSLRREARAICTAQGNW